MDKQLLDKGREVRRKLLGEKYTDLKAQAVDDFSRPFHDMVAEYCYGQCWTDETLNHRERSILNLGMLGALGKQIQFETHVRVALRNGLSQDELRAVLMQVAVYCGVPAAMDCFRIASKVLSETAA